MEKLAERAKRRGAKLAAWIKGVISGVGKALRSGEKRAKIGRYAALALLLALLGAASHAYRSRGVQASVRPAATPRPALSLYAPQVTPQPEATPEPARWTRPLEGDVVGGYSPDAPVWSKTLEQWQTHPGLDIAGSPGEAVYACGDGTVAETWNDRLWGNVVMIEHGDGYQSLYASLNTLEMVSAGDAVEAGQVIGSVGRSAACESELGWHLHFELTRNGEPIDFSTLLPE